MAFLMTNFNPYSLAFQGTTFCSNESVESKLDVSRSNLFRIGVAKGHFVGFEPQTLDAAAYFDLWSYQYH